MKHLWLILFVLPLFAQSPCEDETFVELSKRSIGEGSMSQIHPSISGEDFDYFLKILDACKKNTPRAKKDESKKKKLL